MGSLIKIQGPMESFVTVDFAKKFMHVDTAADDERIELLIAAAIARIDGRDGILGRALSPQTWRYDLAGWPAAGGIQIPLPPLIGVTSITYLDSAGAEQVFDPVQYRVYNTGGMRSYVGPATGYAWPSSIGVDSDSVRITFDAGYRGDQSPENIAVLETIRQAVVMTVISWYERPGLEDIPAVVNSLLAPHKVDRLGIL